MKPAIVLKKETESVDALIAERKKLEELLQHLPGQIKQLQRRIDVLSRAGKPDERNLTTRQLEVLRLVEVRFSNKEIASQLNITERTVKSHLHKLLSSLNVKNRTELYL